MAGRGDRDLADESGQQGILGQHGGTGRRAALDDRRGRMAQVRAIVPGGDGAIYKARIVRTKIAASLDDMEQDEDAPDPMETWANKAAVYKDEAFRAMETAVEAEESVAASADAAKENAEAARRSAESADEDANDADSSAKAAAESARVAAKRAKEAASSASMLQIYDRAEKEKYIAGTFCRKRDIFRSPVFFSALLLFPLSGREKNPYGKRDLGDSSAGYCPFPERDGQKCS